MNVGIKKEGVATLPVKTLKEQIDEIWADADKYLADAGKKIQELINNRVEELQ